MMQLLPHPRRGKPTNKIVINPNTTFLFRAVAMVLFLLSSLVSGAITTIGVTSNSGWNTFDDYDIISDNNDDNDFRAMLIGASNDNVDDKDDLHVTLHHNRFVNCDQRLPRVRFSELVHVYNNYFENVEYYAVGSAMGAYVLVERNYFLNVEDPIDTCVGVGAGDPPGEPGFAADRDNQYEGSPSGSCHANIGAGDLINGKVPAEPSSFYRYIADDKLDVPDITRLGAGTGKLVCGGNEGRCS